ncbi:MAG: CorA family divalent cation transporter [Gammaproteobacteria bacterium]
MQGSDSVLTPVSTRCVEAGVLHSMCFHSGRAERCSFALAVEHMKKVRLKSQQTGSSCDFVWLHVEWDQAGMVELLVDMGISEAAVGALTASSTRPRYVSFADGEIVVVRGINRQVPEQPDDMISLRFYFNEGLVVSAIRGVRRLESIGDVLRQLDAGYELAHPAELIVLLVAQMTQKIRQFVETLDEVVARIEEDEQGVMLGLRDYCDDLTLVRRRSAAVKRYLLPQRAALELLHTSSLQLTPGIRERLHELANLTELNAEDLELCRERAIVMQEDFRNEAMVIIAVAAMVLMRRHKWL